MSLRILSDTVKITNESRQIEVSSVTIKNNPLDEEQNQSTF